MLAARPAKLGFHAIQLNLPGNWKLERLLGLGRHNVVYAARNKDSSEDPLAVKVLLPLTLSEPASSACVVLTPSS